MELFGYCRISSRDQCEQRQIIAMNELNIPPQNIFVDKQSGANFDRPAYKALVEKLQAGDLLWISELSRLGRNYSEIQNQWRILTKEKCVDIAVIDMQPLLDTRLHRDLMGTFIADLVLSVLSFTSANELTLTKQRQREGIAAAKARGVKFGRPLKPTPRNFGELVTQWDKKRLSKTEILKRCKISESTFYRRIAEHRTT
ncbi:MAG: recombinase family protein [Nitrososphaerota archaeon]|jgi:DNA invertase Pin-like site-specific DNA recombinase|nr:recombinase family protein [Nitrososphaerota archaeon]